MKQPALYVSHGSPMIVVDQSPARAFLEQYGQEWAPPKAIIVASAHYEAPGGPELSSAPSPSTIHDFGGFPEILYHMKYPAPGAPALATEAAGLLAKAGFHPRLNPDRGFDHGVWTPLKLMAPQADIPVVSLSIDLAQSPEWHFRVGRALAPLRDEGVAIIGSGSATHNLRAFFTGQFPKTAKGQDWVEDFRAWLDEHIEAGDEQGLLRYRNAAPHAAENHPTEDHILPLFVALGAGGAGAGRRIHASIDHGVLAMDAFAFGDPP
jgi:4,5-DOPA dioxygenase extradiol